MVKKRSKLTENKKGNIDIAQYSPSVFISKEFYIMQSNLHSLLNYQLLQQGRALSRPPFSGLQ